MAGSLAHIVDEKSGEFQMDFIENLGDAHEALHECYEIIRVLTDGRAEQVNNACEELNFPPIEHDLVECDWGRGWATRD